jgi:site-specific DNA-methyltransferase (adenine-specific)
MRVEHLGDNVTLYCGDCREILPTLSGIDAVVTDPPYGISVLKDGGGFFTGPNGQSAKFWGSIKGDDVEFDPSPLLAVAKKTVLFGANHYANKLPNSARWLVWDKRSGRNSNPLADCEMAWTNDTRPARLFSHLWIGACRESERGQHFHPTQKPTVVMEWVIEVMHIEAGETILDPYMGSGTTGVACVRRGNPFIGVEIDCKYFDAARKRIEQELTRQPLFAEIAV